MKRYACLALAAVLGCDGDTGPAGDPGAMGTTGPAGPAGTNGLDGTNGTNGMDGDNIILSAEAAHGLDISPVTLDLTGKTADEIEMIGRGSYIVNAIADCDGCHDSPENPPRYLAGGAAFPIGPTDVVYVRNLTPDPTGLTLTEAQFIEALRTGRDFRTSGASLIVMPWMAFRWMSTDDLKAIYAFLRVIPAEANGSIPVDVKPVIPPYPMPTTYNETAAVTTARVLPAEEDMFGSPIPDVGNVRRGLAIQPFNDPPALASMTADEVATYARGAYIVQSQGICSDCHTNPFRDLSGPPFLLNTDEYLSGGTVFDLPPPLQPLIGQRRAMSANLLGATGFFSDHSFVQFLGVIETGLHHDIPLGWPMPWTHFRQMTIDDLAAVYTFLKVTQGAYPRPDKATQNPARYCDDNPDCTGSGETCDTTNHECVGGSCSTDVQCGACQTCAGGTACAAPASGSPCLTAGL